MVLGIIVTNTNSSRLSVGAGGGVQQAVCLAHHFAPPLLLASHPSHNHTHCLQTRQQARHQTSSVCPPFFVGCIPCGFGYTSEEGATDESECVKVDVCPVGTEYKEGIQKALSLASCVCKPGFGADASSGTCHRCPAGSYSRGGDFEGKIGRKTNTCHKTTSNTPEAGGKCMTQVLRH